MKSECDPKPVSYQQDPERFVASVLIAIKDQISFYPESSLRDIYKSFFQDEYGPGHLLEDPQKARLYFYQELAGMRSRGRRYTEPCGRGCNFLRVPMDLILDGLVGADEYFSAFLDGASGFMLPDPAVWKKNWNRIFEIVRPLSNSIKEFEKDSAEISEALEREQCVMHHSRQYQRIYDPHYRVIGVRHTSAVAAAVSRPFY